MMITKQQFRDAMVIVETYCSQLHKAHVIGSAVNEVGCRVKLSSWGLEMQGKRKSKLVGTVVDYIQWMHYKNDGTVTVKWDGISKPDSMHISQIEALK
jgi:hypothetical protein